MKKIIENSVFAESVMQRMCEKQNVELTQCINKLLISKAQELGKTLYEVCAMYVPEIKNEEIAIDWYKEGDVKFEWRPIVRLVPRE